MDQIPIDQAAAWAVVAPMIQARQREIAERSAAGTTTPVLEDVSQFRAHEVQGRGDTAQVQPPLASDRSELQRGSYSNKAALSDLPLSSANAEPSTRDAQGLTPDEQEAVDALKARDREVRNHEQAHARVGGQYASSPTYSYQTGPDGQQYAIGGAVQIDVSPIEGDPEATIDKMETVKAAALAPAEPSAADRQVASLADGLRAQAVADLWANRRDTVPGAVDTRV